MTLEIKIADSKDVRIWNEFADRATHGSVYHTWEWLKIAEKHTKSRLIPLIGYKGTEPVGIYPLFLVKRKGIRSVFSPPPGTAIPYLGPAILNYENFKQSKRESIFKSFHRAVNEFILSEYKPNYISVSLVHNLDPRPYMWSGYRLNTIFDYHLDLTKGEEYVWRNFDYNLRQHVKRAIKNNVRVENGTKEDLEIIYNLLVERYEEQNKVVTTSKKYLFELYDKFQSKGLRVFTAKYDGEVVGGLVALFYKDKVIYWIGTPKPKLSKISPNDLVQWEVIRIACSHGFKVYEEIGAGTERLAEFKAKYNPDLSIRFKAVKSSGFYAFMEGIYKKIKHLGIKI